jgi:hypothetical protein
MALINYTPLQDNVTPVNAASVNNPLTTIYDEFNGNIQAVNLAANAVTTPKIANGAVTPEKIDLGIQHTEVEADEVASGGGFGDLATPGPTLTVNIEAGRTYLVLSEMTIINSVNNSTGRAQIELTGANTDELVGPGHSHTGSAGMGRYHILTGLNAGSTTFKTTYRRGSSGTANFSRRKLTIIPLGQ